MEAKSVQKNLSAEHGVVCGYPDDLLGYFGWPSVARMDDGTLVAVASGLRNEHVCPFGRTVICLSHDDGSTWTSPRVINDSPLDDRDAGVVCLGPNKLMVSWFTTDNRKYHESGKWDEDARVANWPSGLAWVNDATAQRWIGSWVRHSDDGGESWHPPIKVPLTAPHGPIRLRNGTLLYLGKPFGATMQDFSSGVYPIQATGSDDGGRTWADLGGVPLYEGTAPGNYHEAYAVQMPSGRLIGHIRLEDSAGVARLSDLGLIDFSLMQTESDDGGKTWSRAQPLGFHGSPPHLLRHSSEALVCVYGRRQEPYGQRVAISRDEGKSWEYDYTLRDDGPDWDLGYPASVELGDGSIFTLYYQKHTARDKCSILWSRWRLPD